MACREFVAAAPENVRAWQVLSVVCQRLGHAEEWIRSRSHVARLQLFERGFPAESRADVEVFILAAEGASTEVPTCVPEVYVAQTFDAYTDTFDDHLLGVLKYSAHIAVADAAKRFAYGQDLDVLDLGCGTGLVGLEMAEIARRLCGIDISAKMVERARARDVYTSLVCTSITSYLEETTERYDVIVAADVLNYIGELGQLFPLTRSVLRDWGLVVFSIEHTDDQATFRLQPNRRYAHGLHYVQRMAASAGFESVLVESVALRIEHNESVAGEIVTLRANPL